MTKGRPTPYERVTARLVTVGDCQEYDGARTRFGYGSVRVTVTPGVYESRNAHRVVWEHHHGEIPDDLLVRHRCDNPPCCNIKHLELGTRQDNVNDMIQRNRSNWSPRKRECARGHLFTVENTYVYVRPNGKVQHNCRACLGLQPYPTN